MKKFATIILNRNLKKETEVLFNSLKKYKQFSDIYILESGSDKKNLTSYYTWHANWPSANRKGLRFFRGMNYALSNLYKENKFAKYEYFLLLSNDVVFKNKNFYKEADNIFKKNKRLGLLCGISDTWDERKLFDDNDLKYVWYIQNNSIFLRREFIEQMMSKKKPGYLNFLFDGTNFRGFGVDTELIAKGYANYWATAVTKKIKIGEQQKYLLEKSEFIKTEKNDENLRLYIKEGLEWMQNKYGYKSKWSMIKYSKAFYDLFFSYYPELKKFKI